MLAEIAASYVDAINGGALPTISTAWQAVVSLESQRAMHEARERYAAAAAKAIEKEAMVDEAARRREAWP